MAVRVHYREEGAVSVLSEYIKLRLERLGTKEVIVLAIGTDRSTGDALGPLVGSKLVELKEKGLFDGAVYGTLDEPVHADNLAEVIGRLKGKIGTPGVTVIAVDASIGSDPERVGMITVSMGPMRPGAGSGKVLPAVGDVGIYGCVTVESPLSFIAIAHVRLSMVVQMVDVIAKAICDGVMNALKRGEGVRHVESDVVMSMQEVASAGGGSMSPDVESELRELLRVARVYGWTVTLWQVLGLVAFGAIGFLLWRLFAEVNSFVKGFGGF